MTGPGDVWEGDSSPEITVDTTTVRPAAPVSELRAERFGKYLIVGELALGGMAELFLGVQRGIEGFVKVVVIKRVLRHYSDNPTFVQMFIDEARLAARLEHANVVRTYEFGEVDGHYYTAMEYLPGEDLAKVLERLALSGQQVPFITAATIVSQVCAGLHFAHELTDSAGAPLGLVHRDVNPANVVMTYAGDVKLIDFGVARTAMHAKTASGTIKGKLAYMSPEHLLGRNIDRRSDVFSTGIVLWELLTGQPLFVRGGEAATIYAIMNDPIPPVSRLRPDVPPELEAIVMRALARTPADRYESAEEMQIALDGFLAGREPCDARARARLLEELFGPTRADAKRSIAQTRALATNISLVMKLRSDARADLAETVDALALGTERQLPAPLARPRRAGWLLPALVAAGVVLALGAGLVLVAGPGATTEAAPPSARAGRASLRLASTPSGAAISIGGEPTGLTTPATITGLAQPNVVVALELPGFATRVVTLEVPASGTISEHIALVAAPAPTAEAP